jgi:hypothetical protein
MGHRDGPTATGIPAARSAGRFDQLAEEHDVGRCAGGRAAFEFQRNRKGRVADGRRVIGREVAHDALAEPFLLQILDDAAVVILLGNASASFFDRRRDMF